MVVQHGAAQCKTVCVVRGAAARKAARSATWCNTVQPGATWCGTVQHGAGTRKAARTVLQSLVDTELLVNPPAPLLTSGPSQWHIQGSPFSLRRKGPTRRHAYARTPTPHSPESCMRRRHCASTIACRWRRVSPAHPLPPGPQRLGQRQSHAAQDGESRSCRRGRVHSG